MILFFFESPSHTGSNTSSPGRPSCPSLGHSPQPLGEQVSISVRFEVLSTLFQARGDIVGEAVEGERPADQIDERDTRRHKGSLVLQIS